MLTVLVNNIQHLSVEIQTEIPVFGFFYEILHSFANLGESARIYLINQQTVGRLLAYFLGEIAHPVLVSQSLEFIPQYQLEKEFFIPVYQKAVFVSEAEAKATMVYENKDRFLILVVSTLVRQCRFVKTQKRNPLEHPVQGAFSDQDNLVKLDSDEL